MNEQEKQELMSELVNAVKSSILSDLKTEIMAEVNPALNGLSAKLTRTFEDKLKTKEVKDNPEVEKISDVSVLSLKSELEQFKAQLEKEKQDKHKLERQSVLSSLTNKTVNPTSATKLLDLELGDKLVKSENGEWYVKNDNDSAIPIKQYVDSYLSGEGSWLARGTEAAGSGGESGNPKQTKSTSKETTLADLLSETYGS